MTAKCDCGHALRDHYGNPDSDALPQPCAECPCDHFVEIETDD